MSYFAPYLDAAGIHLPTYEDRLQALLESYQTIFSLQSPPPVSAPDYQLLSVFARALDDLSALILASWAARNPAYATGASLDLLLGLAGLQRSGPTHSTAMMKLTGVPNTTLQETPRILDANGNMWTVYSRAVINANGLSYLRATCETPGHVEAPAGTINQIVSPVAGLYTATNMTAATPGADAETDVSARNRFALSLRAPSLTLPESMRAAILSIPEAASCRIHVNDGSFPDADGIPAHSVCAVVLYGSTQLIGETVFAKKAPGIGTYGNTDVTVTDGFGESHTVSFMRPEQVLAVPRITLRPLPGFSQTAVVPKIREAVRGYINALGIGEALNIPALYGVIYGADPSSAPTFAVTALDVSVGETVYTSVLEAAWNQVILNPENLIVITVES